MQGGQAASRGRSESRILNRELSTTDKQRIIPRAGALAMRLKLYESFCARRGVQDRIGEEWTIQNGICGTASMVRSIQDGNLFVNLRMFSFASNSTAMNITVRIKMLNGCFFRILVCIFRRNTQTNSLVALFQRQKLVEPPIRQTRWSSSLNRFYPKSISNRTHSEQTSNRFRRSASSLFSSSLVIASVLPSK